MNNLYSEVILSVEKLSSSLLGLALEQGESPVECFENQPAEHWLYTLLALLGTHL